MNTEIPSVISATCTYSCFLYRLPLIQMPWTRRDRPPSNHGRTRSQTKRNTTINMTGIILHDLPRTCVG